MKTNNWKDIAELVGIAAIVASLVFVGLQMRQSQGIAIANQYQNRADTALEWYLARAESPQLFAATTSRIADNAALGNYPKVIQDAVKGKGAEFVAVNYLEYRSNLTMFDNYHFQYEQGFLTDEAWQAFRVRLKAELANKLTAGWYLDQNSHWRQTFRELCSELLAELEVEATGRQRN